jgi:hypothetical protein
MRDGAIEGMLLIHVVSIPVATPIHALLLRAAVALYNRIAGGSGSWSVPTPSFWIALQVMFVITLAQLAIVFFIGQLITSGSVGRTRVGEAGVELIAFVAGVGILTVLLWLMLPTPFARAIMVTLCFLLITLLFAGAVIVIVINLSGDVGILRGF